MSTGKARLYSKIVGLVIISAAILPEVHGEPYVVTVGDGEQTVDAAFVTALGASEALVKRGAGVLRSNALLNGYTGEIRVEEGVFVVTENGSLGTAAGETSVSNGATLLLDIATANAYNNEGEKVHISGAGAAGYGGAVVNNGTYQQFMFYKGQLILEGDAVVSRTETGSRYDMRDSSLVMNGHTLTIDMGTRDYAFYLARTRVREPGNIVVNSGRMYIEGNSNAAWDGTAANVITVKNGASIRRQESNAVIPWTLVLENGAYYDVLPDRYSFWQNDNYYRWDGPVHVGGWCLYSANGGTRMLFEGPISGTGPMYFTAGWLWLVNAGNTFSGQVYFNGQGATTSSTGGVVVCSNGALPATSAGAKIHMGDLVFKATEELDLPPVEIEGYGSIVGGRGVMASLKKTGDGMLDVQGVFNVTGRTELAGGMIRLAKMPMGNPGLIKSTLLESETGVGVWEMLYSRGVTFADQGVRTLGFDVMTGTGPSYWPNSNTAVKYTGYLWNRTDEDVTWSFYSYVRQGARLSIDGQPSMTQFQSTGHEIWGPVTLTPGSHKVEMWVICEANAAAGGVTEEGYPLGFGVDRQGRTSEVGGNFAYLEDPGDGSLLTSDTMTKEGLDYSVVRTRLADLSLASGTVLDLNDPEVSAEVGILSGSGIVSNGLLHVSTKWVIRPNEVLEVRNGGLVIDDTATLDFGDISLFPSEQGGVVIARVSGAVVGLNRFSVPAEGWRLRRNGAGEIILKQAEGCILTFR